MNGNWSTTSVGFVGIGALVVGLLLPAAGLFANRHKQGVIKMSKDPHGNYVCQQVADGDKDAFPHLDRPKIFPPNLGNTIAWTGVDANGQKADVDVKFASPSPFTKPEIKPGLDSGTVPSGTAPGDYSFDTVTVGGTPCSAYVDPGVHVNQ